MPVRSAAMCRLRRWLWADDGIRLDSGSSARLATVYMLAAAVMFSLAPLVVVDLSGSASRPLAVGAGVSAGSMAFNAAIRRIHPTAKCAALTTRSLWARCRSQSVGCTAITGPLALVALATLSYPAFSWSTAYVDTAVSAALYEVWPMLWFVAMAYIDRVRHGPGHQRDRSAKSYLLLLAA